VKRVLLGLSTPTFVSSVDELLERTARDGWDFAEFNHLDLPPFSPELLGPEDRARVRDVAGSLGLAITLHAGDWDLLSLDPGLRRYAVSRSRVEAQLTRDLGAEYLATHVGVPQRMMLYNGGRRWADEFFDYGPRIEEAARMLGALADEMGVRILFENTFRLVDPIIRAFAASPSRSLGFLLDVGHANICGGIRELHAAMSAGGRLVAMHVHDNSGVRDEHAPLGAGTVDLTGIALPRFVAVEVRDWQKAVATREDLRQRYM